MLRFWGCTLSLLEVRWGPMSDNLWRGDLYYCVLKTFTGAIHQPLTGQLHFIQGIAGFVPPKMLEPYCLSALIRSTSRLLGVRGRKSLPCPSYTRYRRPFAKYASSTTGEQDLSGFELRQYGKDDPPRLTCKTCSHILYDNPKVRIDERYEGTKLLVATGIHSRRS